MMVISGNTLPVLSGFSYGAADPGRFDRQQPALDRNRESEQQNRRQTVEYIFRGDFDEQIYSDQQSKSSYNQQIDPANQGAIFSYIDTETLSTQRPERQGRMLDIFI